MYLPIDIVLLFFMTASVFVMTVLVFVMTILLFVMAVSVFVMPFHYVMAVTFFCHG